MKANQKALRNNARKMTQLQSAIAEISAKIDDNPETPEVK